MRPPKDILKEVMKHCLLLSGSEEHRARFPEEIEKVGKELIELSKLTAFNEQSISRIFWLRAELFGIDATTTDALWKNAIFDAKVKDHQRKLGSIQSDAVAVPKSMPEGTCFSA